jgi:hypothetical protein
MGNISFTAANPGSSPLTGNLTVTPYYEGPGATCMGGTRNFTITVNPTPVVDVIPDQVVCNNTATGSVNFTGTATSYSWSNDQSSIGLPLSGTGNIASFTALNTGATPVVATLTVTPHYGACVGTVQAFTITVNPSPTVTDPVDQVVCNGSPTVAVVFSGTGSSYSWSNNNTSIGLAGSGTGDIASFGAVNAGTTPVTATLTAMPVFTGGSVSCNGPTQSFTITVNPTPTVSDPVDQVVCNGAATAAVTFSGTATRYDWSNDNTSIGLGASGTGTIGSFAAMNAGSAPSVATLTVTPVYDFGGTQCNGPTQDFTITVNPTPVVDLIPDQEVCNNTMTAGVVFSGVATSYSWSNSNSSIGLASSGTGDIASFTALNTGSVPVVATLTVTPHYGACVGATESFIITVNPTPVVADPADQVVCVGELTTVNFVGTGTRYDWSNDNTSIGLGASGTGTIGSFAAMNAGSTPSGDLRPAVIVVERH